MEEIPGLEPTLDEEDLKGIKKCMDYMREDDSYDSARKLRDGLREFLDKGTSDEDLDRDIYDYDLWDEKVKRELIRQLTAFLGERDSRQMDLAKIIYEDSVTEGLKNDFLNWLESPSQLRRDNPEVFKMMEDEYGRSLDATGRKFLLDLIKKKIPR